MVYIYRNQSQSMKTFALALTLLVYAFTAGAQTVRWYPKTKYCVKLQGQQEFKQASIGLGWLRGDASSLDNLLTIAYPDGDLRVIETPKFDGNASGGKPSFKFKVEDEGQRLVDCYVIRVSDSEIFFAIYYGESLSFSFYINLLEFYTNQN